MTRAFDWSFFLERQRTGELTPAEAAKLEAELATNPGARSAYELAQRGLTRLSTLEPPEAQPSEVLRMIRSVIREYQSRQAAETASALRPSGPRVLIALAAVVCTVWLGSVWLFPRGTEVARVTTGAQQAAASRGMVVRSGVVHTGSVQLNRGSVLPSGTPIEVGATAVFQANDHSRLSAQSGTRFHCAGPDHQHMLLESGRLSAEITKQKPGERFVIETEEARVTVVGTQFSVERSRSSTDEAGPSTLVTVTEGRVEVSSKIDGNVRLLDRGEQARIERVRVGSSQTQAPAVPAPKIADIRSRLRAGDFNAARELISRAHRSPAVDRAELALVEAEADLAEGRYDGAVKRYLSVSRNFAGRPQAELALFAAAQLTIDHGRRDASLLEQYLAKYPRGQFAREARSLLGALKQE